MLQRTHVPCSHLDHYVQQLRVSGQHNCYEIHSHVRSVCLDDMHNTCGCFRNVVDGRGTELNVPLLHGSPHKLRSLRNKSTSALQSHPNQRTTSINSNMSKIVRTTLFKLTDTAVIKEAVQKYSTLSQDAIKVRSWFTSTCTSDVSITSPTSASQVQPQVRLMIPASVHGFVL
jgi:hypothetical protein